MKALHAHHVEVYTIFYSTIKLTQKNYPLQMKFSNKLKHTKKISSFSIPEENESNWHKWNNNISLNHNQRKESPIPPHEAYVDMHPYSPYSCSPGDPSQNAYMPMSPGDYRTG